MPAPKNKTSANANGTTKTKSLPRSGTSTPVSTTGDKDTVEKAATLAGGRPDKKAYENEQETLKKDIDALQAKLATVRDTIRLATHPGSGNERRNELLRELDEIKDTQSGNKHSRTKIFEKMKTKQESIQKKVKDYQAGKSKVPFKTVDEVDAHIAYLEKQVESGNMKLADEKRALAEISSSKRNRRIVESFQTDLEAIEADRREVDELKSQLDDPKAKEISEKFDALKAELDELKKEGDAAAASRSKLFEERDSLQSEIKGLLAKKRESAQQFRETHDRYWFKVNEDRARRAEKARLLKAAEEQQRQKERIDRLLEEATQPAFQAQIEDCQTLVDYLSGKTSGTASYKGAAVADKADLPGVAKLEPRKVEDIPEGSVVRKKKGGDEDAYFVGGKNKGRAKKGASKSETPTTPTTPTTSTTLNIPLPTLSALLSLSIPPPTSSTDVPRVIEDLKTKKAWFEANQARVTAENIARAQEEIQRLTRDSSGAKASAESTEPASPQEPGGSEPNAEVAEEAVKSEA